MATPRLCRAENPYKLPGTSETPYFGNMNAFLTKMGPGQTKKIA